MSAGGISILIISEDGSRHAPMVLKAITKKALSLLRNAVNFDAIRFEPLTDNHAHLRGVVTANMVKAKTNPQLRQGLVDLGNALATKVKSHGGFVLYHVDADEPFSNAHQSDNAARVPTIVREQVRNALTRTRAHRVDNTPAPHEQEIERLLARILFLVPHYSIEAWLYQNTKKAIELLHQHHGGKDVGQFETWGADRALLDEVSKPKEQTALGSNHNQDLAEDGYPFDDAHAHSRSLAATMQALLDSPLASELPVFTYPTPVSVP